jgi:hypothetical protein
MDVALVTCAPLPEPDPDAAPLAAGLAAAGVSNGTIAWDDSSACWSDFRIALLRSSWDYPRRQLELLCWAERVAALTELWNPLPAVRWNSHKGYLLELERLGVPVTPTALVRKGERRTLGELLSERCWRHAVVKPAVSAASYRTIRVDASDPDEGERHLRALLADGDALVQRYLESVEDYGERALVWIDGELTHAVRKSPRFAGEEESVSEAQRISPAERELARRVLAAVGAELLYARIDAAPGPDGEPVLMELELIEPSLFFAQGPTALERLVAALRRLLDR